MKVLFIGGTGTISSACTELAISKGIDLYLLNRGKSTKKSNVEGAKIITGDIRSDEISATLKDHTFDVVVDWIAFEPEHIQKDIDLFKGKTKQFVFISSASIYQTPPQKLPVTEDTPLENPFWQYSRDKIACERLLEKANQEIGLTYTIVRPSHTYDKALLPITGGYTALQRISKGLPVVVHGDGTSIWTFTHHKDFAVGFVGLLGNTKAYNQAFHITNNELLSWNAIYNLLAGELNVEPNLVYVPSDIIAKYDSEIGDGLLGDKAHSMIFDNSKIKSIVPEFDPKIPFSEGVKEMVAWHKTNTLNLEPDPAINKLMDQLIKDLAPFR